MREYDQSNHIFKFALSFWF